MVALLYSLGVSAQVCPADLVGTDLDHILVHVSARSRLRAGFAFSIQQHSECSDFVAMSVTPNVTACFAFPFRDSSNCTRSVPTFVTADVSTVVQFLASVELGLLRLCCSVAPPSPLAAALFLCSGAPGLPQLLCRDASAFSSRVPRAWLGCVDCWCLSPFDIPRPETTCAFRLARFCARSCVAQSTFLLVASVTWVILLCSVESIDRHHFSSGLPALSPPRRRCQGPSVSALAPWVRSLGHSFWLIETPTFNVSLFSDGTQWCAVGRHPGSPLCVPT